MQRNWNNYDDIMSVDDVQKMLGIGKRSARTIIKEQGGIKLAGKWLISKAKIKAMFE